MEFFICFIVHREVLDLPDGGQLALDWLEDGCASNSPILLILPGLTGSSQAEYIRCLVKAVNRSGFRTVVFNNRGLGGIQLKVLFANIVSINCHPFNYLLNNNSVDIVFLRLPDFTMPAMVKIFQKPLGTSKTDIQISL